MTSDVSDLIKSQRQEIEELYKYREHLWQSCETKDKQIESLQSRLDEALRILDHSTEQYHNEEAQRIREMTK